MFKKCYWMGWFLVLAVIAFTFLSLTTGSSSVGIMGENLPNSAQQTESSTSDFFSVNPNEFPIGTTTNWELPSDVVSFEPVTLSVISFSGVVSLRRDKSEHFAESQNQQLIEATVKENPGITLRGIQRVTKLGMGTVQYHLAQLEGDILNFVKLGKSHHFFLADHSYTNQEQLWICVLQNQTAQTIVEAFLSNHLTDTRQADLSSLTALSRSLVSYYVKKLVTAQVLDQTDGRICLNPAFKQFVSST